MSEDQRGAFGAGEDSAGSSRPASGEDAGASPRRAALAAADRAPPASAPAGARPPQSPAMDRLDALRREVEALEGEAARAEEASLLARKAAAEERIRQNGGQPGSPKPRSRKPRG